MSVWSEVLTWGRRREPTEDERAAAARCVDVDVEVVASLLAAARREAFEAGFNLGRSWPIDL